MIAPNEGGPPFHAALGTALQLLHTRKFIPLAGALAAAAAYFS
jgi:hypothetical protein